MKRKEFFKRLFTLGAAALGLYGINGEEEKKTSKKDIPIKLVTTNIAGLRYYRGIEYLNEIKPDDSLTLKREPLNIHDSRAIAIFWKNTKLGYVPRQHNAAISSIIDAKIEVQAYIAYINPEQSDWYKVFIRIFMGE